ncbi:hypothetical protein F2Q70_00023460 [Brassica cretica]|uniref:Uncharacterized protein n=1 Tax=Brassica cretica TaxID=69181 RepID=A0A8S9GW77_BRACR|nr:hypothetical protein F2Q70_00023460 [Brassica cretica]
MRASNPIAEGGISPSIDRSMLARLIASLRRSVVCSEDRSWKTNEILVRT